MPAVPDRDVAFKVLVFVEARRVLFSTYSEEVPDQCVQSVIAIRDFLTNRSVRDTLPTGYLSP